jgi:DNA helicase MCM8
MILVPFCTTETISIVAELQFCSVSQCSDIMGAEIGEKSLASKLRLHPEKDRDFVPLPEPLLRKYISYARNYVTPRYCFSSFSLINAIYVMQ